TGEPGYLFKEHPLDVGTDSPIRRRRLESIEVVAPALVVISPAGALLHGGMQVHGTDAVLVNQHGPVVSCPAPHVINRLMDLFGSAPAGVEHDVVDGLDGRIAGTARLPYGADPTERDGDMATRNLLGQ